MDCESEGTAGLPVSRPYDHDTDNDDDHDDADDHHHHHHDNGHNHASEAADTHTASEIKAFLQWHRGVSSDRSA